MRDDPFPGIMSPTLARLRRALTIHRATATPEGASTRAPRGESAAGGNVGLAVPDTGSSRTERHLQVLGVGQPPDRVETGIPGFRW